MSSCTVALTLPWTPVGVVEENLGPDFWWAEDFLDLKSLESLEPCEYEEKSMRRSLRINDQQKRNKNSETEEHGKKRRKSIDANQNKSDETDIEDETPKIPHSKPILLITKCLE